MHLMDQENSQESINNIVKDDNNSSVNIHVNSILRVTTMYDVERIGKVVAYDSSSNMVTLRELRQENLVQIFSIS